MSTFYAALLESKQLSGIVPMAGPLVSRPSQATEGVPSTVPDDEESEEESKFNALVKSLKKRGNVKDPEALAAWLGARKFGAKKMQKMAAAGRK